MITLVKIWSTSKNELIDIIKSNNLPLSTNKIIRDDFNQGLKTNNFKYIHIIVSLMSFDLLDNFSKKIVSNNNFILCEDSLFNGIKEIGFDNLFTNMEDIVYLNKEFYNYITDNFLLEYPSEKLISTDNTISLIYMLSFYNVKIIEKYNKNKYFKLYCSYASSLDDFIKLFNYKIDTDSFNKIIQDRFKMISSDKKAIIITFILNYNIDENDIFQVINILEKYNWEEIKIISYSLQNEAVLPILLKIGSIKKGNLIKILTNFLQFIKLVRIDYILDNSFELLNFVDKLSKFKTVEEMYNIFKFLLTFVDIVNNKITNEHIYFINFFLQTSRDLISCIIPGINQYSIFLENKLKYIKILMPLDLEKRKQCKKQIEVLLKFCFIDNLEPILEQFKNLFYDNRTDLSDIIIVYLNDCILQLIISNKIVQFDIDKIIHFKYSHYNITEFDPLQRIAKILLFCKHNKYNIDNTLKFKLNLLTVPSSTSYIEYIKKLDIVEEHVIANNNIYDRGIDVHNESRDDKTKTLILRFFELYSLTKDEEVKYFDEFWDYKRTLSPTKLEIFYRVCGYDENMNEIGRNTNDFGGFLTGDIVLGGVTYKAKNFIALFWKFASTFDDPNCINDEVRDEDCIERDRDNIKYGIINGLVDSLDVRDNHVVCNPGKIQRLAVSVLQGRIKDNGKLLYVDSGIEEVVVKDEYITNLNEIYNYLKPFYSFCTEHPTMEIERFFNEFFIFLNNLNVKVNYSYALYCIIMMSDSEDGLVINPELSLASNYDMFNINDYIEMYLTQEKIEFDLANPQIVAVRERRRIQNERNKIILRERNERIQMGNEDYF